MQYKLLANDNGILKIETNMFSYVPNDLANTDWQAYQAWLAADPSNQPLPADA